MKKNVLLFVIYLITLIGYTQSIRTDKYEVYLTDIEVNEIQVAKSMGMTPVTQYFYEGAMEVTCIESNKTQNYTFYFSTWDDAYKEFLIKDETFQPIAPEISFKDKETALLVVDSKVKEFKLKDVSTNDQVILSNMIVWLENQPKEEVIQEAIDKN